MFCTLSQIECLIAASFSQPQLMFALYFWFCRIIRLFFLSNITYAKEDLHYISVEKAIVTYTSNNLFEKGCFFLVGDCVLRYRQIFYCDFKGALSTLIVLRNWCLRSFIEEWFCWLKLIVEFHAKLVVLLPFSHQKLKERKYLRAGVIH